MSNERTIKSLSTLTKIEKHRLDELQVLISKLDDRISREENKLNQHDQTLLDEMALASKEVEAGLHQNTFSIRMKTERLAIVEHIENLKVERDILQEQRVDRFQALKRYDLLKDKKTQQDFDEEKYKEQLLIDEIAITRFKH